MSEKADALRNFIEVQYHCPDCNINFVVHHQTDTRNTHCWYCSHEVKLTGVERKIKGEYFVTYKDGIEVTREKIKEKRFHQVNKDDLVA